MAVLTNSTTLEEILASGQETIYYGALTCWWTHEPYRCCQLPGSGLPCDPRGGVLYMAPLKDFIAHALANAENYGRHGLKAFLAAHDRNCRVSETDPRSTCLETREEYNALLDTTS